MIIEVGRWRSFKLHCMKVMKILIRIKVRCKGFSGELPCKDCGMETFRHEYYMVTKDVWNKANRLNAAGFLCIGCLESRLNRTLVATDFSDCPLNQEHRFRARKSERLLSRQGF